MSEPRDRISEGLVKSTGASQPGRAAVWKHVWGQEELFQMGNFD